MELFDKLESNAVTTIVYGKGQNGKIEKNALNSAKTDHVEIRINEGRGTEVSYVGKELESIGESSMMGGRKCR